MKKSYNTRINFEFPEECRRELKELAARKGTTIKLVGVKLFQVWIKKNRNSKKLEWLN